VWPLKSKGYLQRSNMQPVCREARANMLQTLRPLNQKAKAYEGLEGRQAHEA